MRLCGLRHRWSPSEQREVMRRRLLFAYYLMKSPFFDNFTGYYSAFPFLPPTTFTFLAHSLPLCGGDLSERQRLAAIYTSESEGLVALSNH